MATTAPTAPRLRNARAAQTTSFGQMPELLLLDQENTLIPAVFGGNNYVFRPRLLTSSITKETIGLGNVDNTSDLSKPISTAVQAAIDDLIARIGNKANQADLSALTARVGVAEGKIEGLETFMQSGRINASRIDGLDTAIDARIDANPSLRPTVFAGPNDW